MMTHKQRMLAAVRGDLPDHTPYAPRIDLWYNANSLKGTLPQRHQGKTIDQIALSEGWALHKVVADHLHQPNPDAMLHRALGVHFMKEYVAHVAFTDRVKFDVQREGDRTRIRYSTAKGSITTRTVYSQEMRRSGTSVPWIEEHAVKSPDDLKVLAHLLENMDVIPHYEPFMDLIRDSGTDVAEAVCPAPMTKVTIQEYYRRWGDRLTIFGGVPSNLLLPQLTPDDQFKNFMERLFTGIGDGSRFILGIADTTPPDADFERLVRIGAMVRERGRLPLQAGAFNPVDTVAAAEVIVKRHATAPARPDTRFTKIRQAVLDGQEPELIEQVKELLKQNVAPKEIIDQGMVAAMDALNQSFKEGTVFIPEVLVAARAMNSAVRFLEPYLADTDKRGGGKILIGTVRGDMHDIGKNMVATLLRGVGFNVVDLGINVAADVFVQKVVEERPQVLALSALLTTTMPEMGKVIGALSQAGVREAVNVIVGGAPVNQNFANDIGANGYATDAADAIDLVRSLIK